MKDKTFDFDLIYIGPDNCYAAVPRDKPEELKTIYNRTQCTVSGLCCAVRIEKKDVVKLIKKGMKKNRNWKNNGEKSIR